MNMKEDKKVEIYNDKKEKQESFEASMIEDIDFYDSTGYGADEKEAKEDLKLKIEKHFEYLKKVLNELTK